MDEFDRRRHRGQTVGVVADALRHQRDVIGMSLNVGKNGLSVLEIGGDGNGTGHRGRQRRGQEHAENGWHAQIQPQNRNSGKSSLRAAVARGRRWAIVRR
ncbi:hypothetical protein ACFQYP_17065 [Nonomuraea antimicrobica]